MPGFTVKIDNILGGQGPSLFFNGPSEFDTSIGIDPDMPISDSVVRISGMLRPTAMAKFSSTNVTGYPLHFLTSPKNALIYAYMSDGKITSYTNALSSETLVGTPTSGAGNGAGYYDNYHYFLTPTDVSRYGPLNGSPSLVNNYWTSTLAKTALINTSYPAINGVTIPNHPSHYHAPNHTFYFGDVVGGKGTIHFIKTTKTSVEGDTDNGSTYAKLTTTPFGYLPTCFESYGSDLVTGWVQGTDANVLQKNAVITFWDTVATSPTKTISAELPDPLVTAMRNVDGILYVWLGNTQGGTRVIKFAGGYSFQEVGFWEECYPPLAGAVDHWLNRVIFGGQTSYPEVSASVFAVGSKSATLSANNPVHNILKTTSAGANPMVTACKYVLQGNNKIRSPIVGWKDDSTQGIDKISTTYGVSVWRSEVFRIGRPFQIKSIRIPLAVAVASNMTLIPKIFLDEQTANVALQTINATNYPNSQKNIVQSLKAPTYAVAGWHNFQLELRWSGTVLLPVSLPITIYGETLKDAAD